MLLEAWTRSNKVSASSIQLLQQTEGGGDLVERQLIAASTGVGCRVAVSVRRLKRKRRFMVRNRYTAFKAKIQELKTIKVHAHDLAVDKAQLQLRVGALEMDASYLVSQIYQINQLEAQLNVQRLQALTHYNNDLPCLQVDNGFFLEREAVTMQYAQGQGEVALLVYLKGEAEAGEPLLIPLESTVAIMLHVVVGLKSLHDKGLIHIDVKATNYLVRASSSESGYEVKIADFGFTEYVGTTEGFVMGPTSGTPGYVAP
ncbi:hypothetical protein CEUSTIGMA_g2515.t1 [Chlamydomonas eustigma]|uniref:Protein kinase domain-containing protein n=1 Tax=Chlamydomonas eustigma TaxID=1157962 RepID=A0A250WW79_9CHLO|nr:hypothetical protein CEUSTIGMA_g2515.t1 [Chlamydomonas eustigma]|eukprot:GAX75071.1 hypothetical protein CEUSTIGMA_g2515.t1 [Chlamydomonas eustigma]